jgi:signal transduction histidine kinase
MPIFRRRNSNRPQSTFIVVLLLLTLGLAGLLAHQAQQAARSHREVAESTLRDYAAFAAWKFAGMVRGELHWMFSIALEPVVYPSAAHGKSGVPDPASFTVAPEKAKYFPPRMVRSYFRLDFKKGKLALQGERPPPPVKAWMMDTLALHAHTLYRPDWKLATVVWNAPMAPDEDSSPYGPHVFVYTLDREVPGAPHVAAGFELDPAAFGPVLERLFQEEQYFPPSLVGDLPTDSLMSVVVSDAAGNELYRSPRQYSDEFAAEDSVGTMLGDLTVRVALRPEMAEQLVIGGLPKSRLPVLLGLLALTAGLVGAALLQHRREYELAGLRAEFVSNVSHELRTPLAQIRMFAETLLLGRVRSPEERRRSLEIIDQEARRLTNLVENVLHFSRAERGAVRLVPEPTDLGRLVRDVVDGFLPLARARQATLRTDLQEGVVALVDRAALRQMLLNLLDNAVKYGPPGQRITVGSSGLGKRARLRVDDEGPGIPRKDRARVWERFWRLEREAESAVAGAGIGLSVVGELARRHGGRAWVEDAPTGGARFVVELPVAASAATGVSAAPGRRAGADQADGGKFAGAGIGAGDGTGEAVSGEPNGEVPAAPEPAVVETRDFDSDAAAARSSP